MNIKKKSRIIIKFLLQINLLLKIFIFLYK